MHPAAGAGCGHLGAQQTLIPVAVPEEDKDSEAQVTDDSREDFTLFILAALGAFAHPAPSSQPPQLPRGAHGCSACCGPCGCPELAMGLGVKLEHQGIQREVPV